MDNVDPIPEKFVLELWSVKTRRMLGIELTSDTIGKLNTIHVANSDDNLIPLYVLTKRIGPLCWTWVTGDCGETCCGVAARVFPAFLVLPCARILLFIGWYAGYSSFV